MSYQIVTTIQGITPYSQSRMHMTEKLEKEAPDAFDARTWLKKAHFNRQGHLFIPAMGLKQALDATAKYLSEKIPGKGQATYSKHFRSGVLILQDPVIYIDDHPATEENVYEFGINANSDGVRGSGKRVWRRFPQIDPPWTAEVQIMVTDHVLEPGLIQRYLSDAGNYIGIGRFRPENGGTNGRFKVVSFETSGND